jgi:hypothetical protein
MEATVISELQKFAESSSSCLPLYILNYLFDAVELTPAELLASTEESAQYSLHAVGLVFDRTHKRIISVTGTTAKRGSF